MRHPLPEAMIEQAAALFRALGDGSRLRILRILMDAREPMNQGTVAREAGLSQANASKHLSCLVREGLATRTQEGTMALYSAAKPLATELCGMVCDHVGRRIKASYKSIA